jgi:hypothetical protein
MTQEPNGKSRRALSPWWWGVAGLALGGAFGILILWTGDPKAPFGETLGNALAAFVGFVVAGWGITQARIANQQAKSSADQVETMRKQLDAQRMEIADAKAESQRAAEEAAFQRDHAERTLRATIKQRLDAQAPTVIAHTEQASGGMPLYRWRYAGVSYMRGQDIPPSEWFTELPDVHPIDTDAPDARAVDVQIAFGVRFKLLGDTPARIECSGLDCYDLQGVQWPIILTPERPEARVTWQKTLSANQQFIEAGNKGLSSDPFHWRPEFWVRDLGMNTLDCIGFAGVFSVMERGGRFMSLTPQAVNLGESYASQRPRKYEYFESPEGKEELGQRLVTDAVAP